MTPKWLADLQEELDAKVTELPPHGSNHIAVSVQQKGTFHHKCLLCGVELVEQDGKLVEVP